MAAVLTSSVPLRRRSTPADPLRKVTLRLHARVADAVRSLVDSGDAPSADAFVEEAIIAQLRERRRETLFAAYAEASHDAAFRADMAALTGAFDTALEDGIGSR
jgi:Arc/MetJ-type ribon-helix-helix transcriptional regulator